MYRPIRPVSCWTRPGSPVFQPSSGTRPTCRRSSDLYPVIEPALWAKAFSVSAHSLWNSTTHCHVTVDLPSIYMQPTNLPRDSSEHEKKTRIDPHASLCGVESSEPRDGGTAVSVVVVVTGDVCGRGDRCRCTAAVFRQRHSVFEDVPTCQRSVSGRERYCDPLSTYVPQKNITRSYEVRHGPSCVIIRKDIAERSGSYHKFSFSHPR